MSRRIEGDFIASGLKFAIVASRFNELVVDRLIDGALDALTRHGVADGDITVVRCPGAFELPQVLTRVLAQAPGRYDGVIALGCVIRGDTPHFDYVASEVTKGVGQAALHAPAPVAFGVLTCDTLDQALQRAGAKAGNKGFEAALAAIELARLFPKL